VPCQSRNMSCLSASHRYLSDAFGHGWRTPQPGDKGVWPPTPDGADLNRALAEKLSVTAWGQMPYRERWERCEAVMERKAEAAAER
jgi:hypothetical protein